MSIRDLILEAVSAKQYHPVTDKELAAIIFGEDMINDEFKNSLIQMQKDGTIYKNKKGRIAPPGKFGLKACILRTTDKGHGFAVPLSSKPKSGSDIFIHEDLINGALDKDGVMVRPFPFEYNSKNEEGEIAYVFNRVNNRIVGTFHQSKKRNVVFPDNKKLNIEIVIPDSQRNNAENKDKVVVEVTNWLEGGMNPRGEITEIIGKIHETGVDILSIIKEYMIDIDFPEDVLIEAEESGDYINDTDKRKDLRSLQTVTIDGEDAKDLDDAITIKKPDNDSFILFVHIADVSHFVKENSKLDQEARARGTSVYLVDRTIPMLPPRLSNDLCSLNAGTDKLSYTCEMKINNSGDIIDRKFYESIICVDRRLSYNDVNGYLDEKEKSIIDDLLDYGEMFAVMKELAMVLKTKREKRGAIEFEFDEAEVTIDEEGNPIDVKRKKRGVGESIIEEFMIAANETVAEYFHDAEIPFIYRIHEAPDKEKLRELSVFLTAFGLKIRNVNNCNSADISEILRNIKGKGVELLVNTIVLRSMQKARYSSSNDSHFGLASRCYTHFTSPIRRYPDLYIHRLMKLFLSGKLTEKRIAFYEDDATIAARTSSELEVRAASAERESVDMKKVEFMRRHLGEQFTGTISNVTGYGFFVELDNTVEGLVKINDLYDDYYIFDNKNYTLTGEMTKRVFRIGDSVDVTVANASVERRQIDFALKWTKIYKQK